MVPRRYVALFVATLIAAPLAPATPALAQQGSVAVIHEPVNCVIADEVVQLDASVPSGARARAYFHSALGTDFFYVEGMRSGDRFVFNLPRPRLDAGPITYYVEFQPEGRTAEYTARVVRQSSDCDGKVAAIGPAPGAVFGPGGAIASPAGFGALGTSVSAATAGGSVAAAGGGGVSAGLLIAGAAVLVGAVVVGVVVSGDDEPASPSR